MRLCNQHAGCIMLVRDEIRMQYMELTHWVYMEADNGDFWCVVDDFGSMQVVHDDSTLYSLINWMW